MHIFIDESGGFQRAVQREHSISCVVAVTIPGRYLSDVENKLKPLAETWPKTPEGEIKGRLLDEEHIAALCALLKPLHVLLEASVMDMNLSTDQEIDYHQSKQAEGMTKNLTDQHHPNLIASVWDLRELLEKMPRQLYAQAASLTELVWKACENGQLYFCQRYPGELGRFRWVIDAKDADRVTPYEKWWRESVMGLVQAKSMRQPVVKLRGGDYSAFYRNFPSLPFPDYLKSDLANPPEKADDVKSILGRELEFSASGVHVGLQLQMCLRTRCVGPSPIDCAEMVGVLSDSL